MKASKRSSDVEAASGPSTAVNDPDREDDLDEDEQEMLESVGSSGTVLSPLRAVSSLDQDE